MLYFLQRILSLLKGNSMHCVFLRTETSTSFQGIVVYMNGFPFVQELKYNHTQPDSFTRTAVCFEGLFLRGTLHTVERNVYTCTCIYIYNYYYYFYCQISHVGHNWHAELKRIARALVFTKGANASRQGIGSGPVTSKKTSEDLWMDVVSRKATFLNKLDMTTRWVNSVSSSNLSCWPQLTCWTETYCKSSCFHQGGQRVSTPLQSHCFKPRKCTVQVTVDG